MGGPDHPGAPPSAPPDGPPDSAHSPAPAALAATSPAPAGPAATSAAPAAALAATSAAPAPPDPGASLGLPRTRAAARLRWLLSRLAPPASRAQGQWYGWSVRLTGQVVRQWARDRCPQQAASLSFQTILSVVPLLAVLLAVLRIAGNVDVESVFVDFLAREIVPVSRQEIAAHLLDWSKRITLESLGLAGLISTLLLAFVMVNSLEQVINHIWRTERRRSLAQKFVIFYAAATIGPFLIGTALYQAAQHGLGAVTHGWIVSGLATFAVLFLANYFLPASPVRWRPAAIGALVSVLLFATAKAGFSLYVNEFAFARYTGIYGALAVAPLWLLWIYYSWLVLLLGVEVAHAAQNLAVLARVDRRGTMSLESELLRRVNGIVAARVMLAICATYASGAKAMSRRALERELDVSDEALARIIARLKSRDLLIETEGEIEGLLPARPPSQIRLADVLASFRGDDVAFAGGQSLQPRLDALLASIEAATRDRLGETTLAELL
jgi:membrane protein